MSAKDTQVGGSHYTKMAIQPVEFIHKNGINFCEGSAIKYLCRWRDKGGIQDLEKAKHFIDLLIEIETETAKVSALAPEAQEVSSTEECYRMNYIKGLANAPSCKPSPTLVEKLTALHQDSFNDKK